MIDSVTVSLSVFSDSVTVGFSLSSASRVIFNFFMSNYRLNLGNVQDDWPKKSKLFQEFSVKFTFRGHSSVT